VQFLSWLRTTPAMPGWLAGLELACATDCARAVLALCAVRASGVLRWTPMFELFDILLGNNYM
jgi:hypothetical protein